MWYFKLGITDKKSKKESNSIVSLLLMSAALPIAPFYIRTLSLKSFNRNQSLYMKRDLSILLHYHSAFYQDYFYMLFVV